MGKYNLAVNRLLERKEIFADLINGTIFQGKQELCADQMECISAQSGVMEEKEQGKLAALERRGDIRMKVNMETYSLIIAGETQEKVHYAMPVRNMLYDALEYTRQVQDLEKKNAEEGVKLDKHSFLSGITKEDRLCPVITTVLYLGGEWDGHSSLYEMLGVDDEDEKWNSIKDYIPDYRINLLTPQRIGDPEKFHTCLKHIFSLVQVNKDKNKLYSYLKEHREELSEMDSVETMAALIILGEQKRVEQMLQRDTEKEEVEMCKAIDDLIQDGVELGERRGKEIGRIEGKIEGKIEGENRCILLIRNLLRDGKNHLIEQMTENPMLREQLFEQYQL